MSGAQQQLLSPQQAIFMPATVDRPAEPAPFVLTAKDAARMLRLDTKRPKAALARYRNLGLLEAVQVGKQVLYPLPAVLRFLARAAEANPRSAANCHKICHKTTKITDGAK